MKPTVPLRSLRPLREAKLAVKLGSDEAHQDRFRRTNRLGTGLLWIGPWRTVWNAEDGARKAARRGRAIHPKYPLKETPSAYYIQRTEWNVRDSDATVLFSVETTLTGGSLKTMDFARKHNKPWLHLCAGDNAAADKLKASTEEHRVKILNVAGPRASKEPGSGGVCNEDS